MNYFAHHCLAVQEGGSPRFALGAMLPDWAHLVGARILSADSSEVADGMRFHHATDHAFHGSELFLQEVRVATQWLCNAGMPRAAARGVSHVGVELLLDGALVLQESAATGYCAALDIAPETARSLVWSRDDAHSRFLVVAKRLRAEELPRAYASADEVARRTLRTLAPRPRLRVPEALHSIVAAWTSEAQPRIVERADQMLKSTRARLSPQDRTGLE